MKSGISSLYKSQSTVFTPQELAAVWGISNYNYLKTRIQYYIKRGHLHRICHGLYVKDKDLFDVLEAGNKLRTPSYVSFETVLFREGIIFQKYSTTFLASYCTTTVSNAAGKFSYRRLKDEILFCKDGLISSGAYCIASKERAFLDAVYLYKNYNFDNLRPLDWEKIDVLANIYGSKALLRRVKEYKQNVKGTSKNYNFDTCHPCEGRDPVLGNIYKYWIPAFAGMTTKRASSRFLEVPLSQNKHRVAMYRLLVGMFRDAYLSAVLGFKGGTACYFFHDLPRFSVDLDFDITAKKNDELVCGEIHKRIKAIIKAEGFDIKDESLKRNTIWAPLITSNSREPLKSAQMLGASKRATGTYIEVREDCEFVGNDADGCFLEVPIFFLVSYEHGEHNVKIEISRRDHPNTYEIKDFYGLPVRVLSKPDIVAHKLVAATERKKTASRDFFDIWFFLSKGWPINEKIVLLRTGKTLNVYLGYLQEFAKKHLVSRTILQGMGEVIDEKQKIWAKNKLKDELIGILGFYMDSLKTST